MASSIAAPINGVGIAGVAPEATLVGVKVCTALGYCFADSVAAGLRYAGDIKLDVVNLSLFADPYLYYCGNDAEQQALYRDLQSAAKYAEKRGVVIVAAAGNESADLQHPGLDTISPDWPPGANEEREVGNNCRVAGDDRPVVGRSGVHNEPMPTLNSDAIERVFYRRPSGQITVVSVRNGTDEILPLISPTFLFSPSLQDGGLVSPPKGMREIPQP